MSDTQVAVLLHNADWAVGCREFFVDDGIRLGSFDDPSIRRLYNRMCEQLGADGGDPLEYGLCARLDIAAGELSDLVYPSSIASRLCNLVVVMTCCPFGKIRYIRSSDGFRSDYDTGLLMEYGEQTESLVFWGSVDWRKATDLVSGWHCLKRLTKNDQKSGRLPIALKHFNLAWQSGLLADAALQLEVCLETLFGRQATVDNLVRQLSTLVPDEQYGEAKVERLVRAILDARQQLIRNGVPDQQSLYDYIPEAVDLVATLLRQVLLDEDRAQVMNDLQVA